MGKLTIDDIAQALGVSKTTVSRAISGKGRISAGTTERILSYIRQHDYHPNAMAQGLASRKTGNIGVICQKEYDVFNLPYFHHCLQGIHDETGPAGYDLLISMTGDEDLTQLERVVMNRKVDGVILTTSLVEDKAATYLKETGMPFVQIGTSEDEDVLYVDNDHLGACRAMTRALLRKGYTHLALVGGDSVQMISQIRRRGYLEACRAEGKTAQEQLIFMDSMTSGSLGEVADRILESGADGVICMDEKLTDLFLQELNQRQVRIPEDLMVASFYNSEVLEHAGPGITAVDVDDRKLGREAARTLLSVLDGHEEHSHYMTDYKILLRESTAPAAGSV